MWISTRGWCTRRAMVEIASHVDKGPVLRRDVARRLEISANYGAWLFRRLRELG